MDMEILLAHTRLDCGEALKDATSVKGKWELAELDVQLVWGWTRRELTLLQLSIYLEDVLRKKMETYISDINVIFDDQRSGKWMRSEFESGRRKRLEHERVETKKRMEKAMLHANQEADKEGRPWAGGRPFSPKWTEAIMFIDKQWSFAINNPRDSSRSKVEEELQVALNRDIVSDQGRWEYLAATRQQLSHERWNAQQEFEIERQSSNDSHRRHL